MPTFTETHYNTTITNEQAWELARSGDPFGGYHYMDWDCPRGGLVDGGDFEVVIIATRGCGNQGFPVLRGLTPKARAAVREGKVKKFIATFNGCLEFAQVAIRFGYAFELGLYPRDLACQFSHRELTKMLEVNSHKALKRLMGSFKQEGLSFGRLQVAIKIAIAYLETA